MDLTEEVEEDLDDDMPDLTSDSDSDSESGGDDEAAVANWVTKAVNIAMEPTIVAPREANRGQRSTPHLDLTEEEKEDLDDDIPDRMSDSDSESGGDDEAAVANRIAKAVNIAKDNSFRLSSLLSDKV